jgi:DNA-binding GntR family transcriptional regulator
MAKMAKAVKLVLKSSRRASHRGRQPAAESATRLNESAYKLILDALFDRRIAAGAFMSQSTLVELLGMPIQPLRDALRVLEVEGLLTIHPRAGIEFLKADMGLIRSTYQFRIIIETAAVRSYAERAPIEHIDALLEDHSEFIRDVETGRASGNLAKLHALERRMHGDLIESLENPLIVSTVNRLQNYTALILMDRPDTAPLIIRTLREHVRVLEACRSRDADSAASEITVHLNSAMHRAMGL